MISSDGWRELPSVNVRVHQRAVSNVKLEVAAGNCVTDRPSARQMCARSDVPCLCSRSFISDDIRLRQHCLQS